MPRSVSLRTEGSIAVVAMAVAALLTLPVLISHDGDPTVLLRVGRYAAARPYVERSFPDPVLTEDYGHDGQQFYVLADTFPHVHDAIPFVDHVRYRFRRELRSNGTLIRERHWDRRFPRNPW